MFLDIPWVTNMLIMWSWEEFDPAFYKIRNKVWSFSYQLDICRLSKECLIVSGKKKIQIVLLISNRLKARSLSLVFTVTCIYAVPPSYLYLLILRRKRQRSFSTLYVVINFYSLLRLDFPTECLRPSRSSKLTCCVLVRSVKAPRKLLLGPLCSH